MDVFATLIEVTAFNPATGAVVVGRLTDRNDPRATTANGQSWLPILASAPSVGTSVFNGAFTGAGEIDLGDFTITLVDGLGDAFTGLVWDGADIKIYAGRLDTGAFPLIYRAVGAGAQRKGRLELQVSLTTRASLLDGNVLTQSYAGSGQLEGDLGLRGTLKPWVFGSARFCKPVLINAAKQIWQVSGYGPVQSTDKVFEGGQEIISFDGDKDLATMLGDVGPAQGKWWRNNQYGIFRLGSQPLYQITAHVRGDTNAVVGGQALTRLGDIIGRILALTSTVTISATSLANLNQLVQQPFDEYFENQISAADAIIRLLLTVGGYYTFNESGNLIFGLVRFGPAVINLDGQNRVEPTVLGINQTPTSAPVWYLRLGAEQCHFVHDASNLPAVIVQQGLDVAKAQATADAKNKTFPPSAQPPVGAIDGDQWPDTSVSPTTMRRFNGTTGTWIATSNQITAANQVPYSSGQTVEALKPAEGGATVGAKTGVNLVDQGGLTLGDSSIKNVLVTIGSNGQLAGAGGGQVTIGGLGYYGDLDAQSNGRITIGTNGAIQGIGTGSGYVVWNSSITLSGPNILGIGSGNGTAVVNAGISIGASGVLAGGGGGQVTIGGLGYSGDLNAQVNSRIYVGASGELAGIGGGTGTIVANTSISLSGSAIYGIGGGNGTAVVNAGVSMGSNGQLAGGGGGQVTIGGLGYYGDLNAQVNSRIYVGGSGELAGIGSGSGTIVANVAIALSGPNIYGIGSGNGSAIVNAGISIGSNGQLAGGGGGQVTIGGLGYGGDLDAQNNGRITISATVLYGIGSGNGTPVANGGISIGSNGVLSGGGGGQVSLPGLGAGGLATKDQAGAGDIAPSAVQLVTYQVLQGSVNCPVGN